MLITGGSGFIGTGLISKLRKRLYVQQLEGKKKAFSDIRVENIFKVSKKYWLSILHEYSIILHLAWYVKHKDYRTSKNLQCLAGTKTLGDASKKAGVSFLLVQVVLNI